MYIVVDKPYSHAGGSRNGIGNYEEHEHPANTYPKGLFKPFSYTLRCDYCIRGEGRTAVWEDGMEPYAVPKLWHINQQIRLESRTRIAQLHLYLDLAADIYMNHKYFTNWFTHAIPDLQSFVTRLHVGVSGAIYEKNVLPEDWVGGRTKKNRHNGIRALAHLDHQGIATFRIEITDSGKGLLVTTPLALVSQQVIIIKDHVETFVGSITQTLNGTHLTEMAKWLYLQEHEYFNCTDDGWDIEQGLTWALEAEKNALVADVDEREPGSFYVNYYAKGEYTYKVVHAKVSAAQVQN
ncbi:hypothetical protein EJ08DRAFT_693842 [Tothia fuscella]|uniref:Uncharacterized protein n=1 Tax=Tothia fuscella TaxID=1048955 RepID=A0A9P4U2S0_9PEZI|nr:hypothetical protein EJ08DRAFT_693842 [Tothia fuscella]